MSKKQQRKSTDISDTAERPDSLKYQHRLLMRVLRAPWATSLDKSVAGEIIENYRKDYGNSRTSLRFLQQATGQNRSRVIASTRRLVEHGPFDLLRAGAGTRPAEYRLKFELVHDISRGDGSGTSIEFVARGDGSETSGGDGSETSKLARGDESVTQSGLRVTGLQPTLHVGEELDSAPAGGDLSASAEAAPTAAVKAGFQALYDAYGLRKGKADALAVYINLNADAAMQKRLVEAATAWRLAAEAKPDCKRKWLATWLREECWDEEVPGSREHLKDRPANDNKLPFGKRVSADIIDADTVADEKGEYLKLWFQTDDGAEFTDRFDWSDDGDCGVVGADQKRFNRMLAGAEIEFEFYEDLIGVTVDVARTRYGLKYFGGTAA